MTVEEHPAWQEWNRLRVEEEVRREQEAFDRVMAIRMRAQAGSTQEERTEQTSEENEEDQETDEIVCFPCHTILFPHVLPNSA
jgi:hypothetical protein